MGRLSTAASAAIIAFALANGVSAQLMPCGSTRCHPDPVPGSFYPYWDTIAPGWNEKNWVNCSAVLGEDYLAVYPSQHLRTDQWYMSKAPDVPRNCKFFFKLLKFKILPMLVPASDDPLLIPIRT